MQAIKGRWACACWDTEATKRAFDRFLVGQNLTSNQIEFINLLVDYLTQSGWMRAAQLYESPFTDFSSKGVECCGNTSFMASSYVQFRRRTLGSDGLLARSLSGGKPGSAGGSIPLLAGAVGFLAFGVTVVPLSSLRTTVSSELRTRKLSPTS